MSAFSAANPRWLIILSPDPGFFVKSVWRISSAGRGVSSAGIWGTLRRTVPRNSVCATTAVSLAMSPRPAPLRALLPRSSATPAAASGTSRPSARA
ncbi:hypothetical protein BD413DRAFT_525065 [Trametes elegans]|nr:hypothetical protein BD413DRAFT_525065 [Trametes elegans]